MLLPLCLCSFDGEKLIEVKDQPGLWRCPKCGRQWTVQQGLQVLHPQKSTPNGPVYAGGAIEFKGAKSGKKHKKKAKHVRVEGVLLES